MRIKIISKAKGVGTVISQKDLEKYLSRDEP